MKNFADLGGCYPPRPSASVDNALLDQQNSSYSTQPHSISANYPNDPFCKDTYMLFAGWEARMVKNCDRGLENAARGHRPRVAFACPRSQFFTIRTDQPQIFAGVIDKDERIA